SPGMAGDAHMFRVDHAGGDGGLRCRDRAFEDRHAWIARAEDDVGHDREVAMQEVALSFVNMDQHRILLAWLVIRRVEERSLQALALRGLIFDELRLAPRVIRLEGIGIADLLRIS